MVLYQNASLTDLQFIILKRELNGSVFLTHRLYLATVLFFFFFFFSVQENDAISMHSNVPVHYLPAALNVKQQHRSIFFYSVINKQM